jgi:hypothetical protein
MTGGHKLLSADNIHLLGRPLLSADNNRSPSDWWHSARVGVPRVRSASSECHTGIRDGTHHREDRIRSMALLLAKGVLHPRRTPRISLLIGLRQPIGSRALRLVLSDHARLWLHPMSACDRPRSGSGFACPHLGIQHHELDPALRKIDSQHVMPVEVTAPTARCRSFAGSHAARWSDPGKGRRVPLQRRA